MVEVVDGATTVSGLAVVVDDDVPRGPGAEVGDTIVVVGAAVVDVDEVVLVGAVVVVVEGAVVVDVEFDVVVVWGAVVVDVVVVAGAVVVVATGVIDAVAVDAQLTPLPLVAVTVNVYAVSAANPSTVQSVVDVVQVSSPGSAVTV